MENSFLYIKEHKKDYEEKIKEREHEVGDITVLAMYYEIKRKFDLKIIPIYAGALPYNLTINKSYDEPAFEIKPSIKVESGSYHLSITLPFNDKKRDRALYGAYVLQWLERLFYRYNFIR
jgi:hypothetical protein